MDNNGFLDPAEQMMARAMSAARLAKEGEFTETAKAFSALARYLGQRDLPGLGGFMIEHTVPPISERTIPPCNDYWK